MPVRVVVEAGMTVRVRIADGTTKDGKPRYSYRWMEKYWGGDCRVVTLAAGVAMIEGVPSYCRKIHRTYIPVEHLVPA